MGLRLPGPTTHPRSKNLWFRMAVPERLRAKVGRREIKFSLETADPSEAKIRQAREQARWRAYFQALEATIEAEAVAAAPPMVDAFLEEMARRNGALENVVFGLQTAIAMRLLIAWGRDEFRSRRADRAFAFMPGRNAWRGTDFGDIAGIIPAEDRDALLARIDVLHRHRDTQGSGFAEVLAYLLEAKRWEVLRIEILLIEDHASITIPLGSPLFEAAAEHLLRRLVEYTHPNREAILASLSSPPVLSMAPTSPAAPPRRATGAKGERPLSEGFAHWAKLRAPRPQSVLEAKRAVERFIALHGDLAVAQIARDHLLDYRDFIGRMPTNLNLEKLKASRLGFRGAVEKEIERAGPDARTLSPGAIKKDLGALSAVLAILRNEGWVQDNVSAGIAVPGYSKSRRAQRAPRLPLRPSMMQTLFASPLFTGCEGPADIQRTRPGKKIYQDELYWSFLFGATAGPRLEEVGQIRLEDIEVIEREGKAPIVAIYITGTGDGESIKNDESARVIVVHPRLLELGFLDYVGRRREARAVRLFDLKQSATGKWTKELSRRVNRYVDRVVTDDPRFVFHSLRHEFKDRAEATISTRVHDRITGHSPATVGGRYGLGASVELMASELEKLDLSFVDWERLRDAASGAMAWRRRLAGDATND
jgi:integrase